MSNIYAVAFDLELEPALWHWAILYVPGEETEDLDDVRGIKKKGLTYQAEGSIGHPSTYKFVCRISDLYKSCRCVGSVHIGVIDEIDDKGRRAADVLEITLKAVEPLDREGEDCYSWFIRGLNALIQEGIVMPEITMPYLHRALKKLHIYKAACGGNPAPPVPAYIDCE